MADEVRPKRVSATLFDMVRSLGVLVVIVGITLLFVPGLLHPNKSQRFQAVGYSDDVAGFKQVSGVNALVPTALPKPWYANSADLKYSGVHAHLHIGWVSPTNDYAALEESNNDASVFIRAILGERGLKVTGHESINGASWMRSISDSGENSLVRTTSDGITVVITGSASTAQQEQLAAALRT